MTNATPDRSEIRKSQFEPDRPPLSIVYQLIKDLRLDPENPRVHSKRQIRQIAKSIELFGFNVPVLIDSQNRVVAGHGRVLACEVLGIERVPTIRVEHLSEIQLRAFSIADNRLTENAEWSDRLLGEQLRILANAEIDFSLEVTGFEISEIDTFIEGAAPVARGAVDPADVIPNAQAGYQVTKVGDVWNLGRHRILCGDARDAASYARLLNGRRAEMVFTDPPFNDPIDKYVSGFGKIHHPEFAMASGEMSIQEFTNFLRQVVTHLARNSSNGALHFICIDWRHISELLSATQSAYTEFKNLCVWAKENAGQGSLYRSQHELIFVFKSGRKPHRNNIQLGQFGRYRTNVWRYARVNSLSRNTESGDTPGSHPTIKPVQLVADAILDCTARGDVALDSFLGSGTTLIAAERTGRICYGLEIEPRYVDAIVRRWQTFTGQSATLEASGQAFNDTEGGRDGQAR